MSTSSESDSWGSEQELTGYPHPFLDYTESNQFDEGDVDLLCLMELRMCYISAVIRAKDRWWEKYRNPEISSKWKKEILAQSIEIKGVSAPISEKACEWVLKELEEYDGLRADDGIQVSCFDGIWHSDELIHGPLRSLLLDAVQVLEDVPDSQKDWHPRSHDLVLDLVHPSLFPIVYGRTLAYPSLDDKDPLKLTPIKEAWCTGKKVDAYAVSEKFSWLPTPFVLDQDGKKCKIDGYINNLHPDKHKELYNILELLFAKFVPLFERVLTDLKAGVVRRITNMTYEKSSDEPEPEYKDGDDIKLYDQLYDKWTQSLKVDISDVGEYPVDGVHAKRKNVTETLAGKRLKVIVKLANIHLTPEKPAYNGGSWHIEGMLNEAIVSTGIFYYDCKNTTESTLSFRRRVGCPMDYEQSDYKGVKMNWGQNVDEPLNQPLGYVSTIQGRCLAFPNLYQHLVSPFKLADKTQPGHRKILVFFLVDPTYSEIPDTSIVPPQQQEWYVREMTKIPEDHPLRNLPLEIRNIIGKGVDGLMDLEEAKKIRLELMDERSVFVKENDKYFYNVDCNMCEH